MLLTATQIAASAVILTLAGSCGRNMLQTSRLINDTPASGIEHLLLPQSSTTDTVRRLKELNREEIIKIFLASSAPLNLSDIEGEWNADLLENNGRVMSTVSKVMTNGLFGMGRRWNGKAFSLGGRGTNRFVNRRSGSSADFEHPFDYEIRDSTMRAGKPSVRLRYADYQSPISLWKTMIDEVRLIPGETDVMLGVGGMAWSGGLLNAAPFVLWRDETNVDENNGQAEDRS